MEEKSEKRRQRPTYWWMRTFLEGKRCGDKLISIWFWSVITTDYFKICQMGTKYQTVIHPTVRPTVTLKHLACGDHMFTSFMYAFKISKQSISVTLPEVCVWSPEGICKGKSVLPIWPLLVAISEYVNKHSVIFWESDLLSRKLLILQQSLINHRSFIPQKHSKTAVRKIRPYGKLGFWGTWPLLTLVKAYVQRKYQNSWIYLLYTKTDVHERKHNVSNT